MKKIKISSLLLLIMTVIFIVTVGIILFTVNRSMKEHAMVEAEKKARIILDKNLSTHTYFTHNLKPAIFKIASKTTTDEYFDPVWMSSTYAIRKMEEYFKNLSDYNYYYKECAINARSPFNEANEYEEKFIQELNANSDLVQNSTRMNINGKPYFVFLRRGEEMKRSCMRCHSDPDISPKGLLDKYGRERSFQRKTGEVVSAISIRVPLESAYTTADTLSIRLSGVLLGVLVIIYVLHYFLGRKMIFKPVAHISEKASRIAYNPKHLGEKISLPSGREFRDLAESFNAMSTNLKNNMDELEGRVTERTSELSELLDEKELLLKEINHRTKNNFALVHSLLNLKRTRVQGGEAGRLLDDIQGRIRSMSLMYESLDKSADYDAVNFDEYVRDFITDIYRAYNCNPDEISMQVKADPIKLDVSKTVTCGLVINEIVTNAIKYAFADMEEKGVIEIVISSDNENKELHLHIRDNGKGLPESVIANLQGSGGSLGVSIIVMLVKKQLRGKIEIYNENGAVFDIIFPV